MEIEIASLRQVTNDLLERLEADGITKLELDADYYWSIPPEHRYDRHDEPKEHVMGQLSEDLAFTNQLIDGTRPPVTYGLVWISSLLRYIGEKIVV